MAAHHEQFRKLAGRVSHAIGTPVAFVIAALAVLIWGVSGPVFGFSDTWQLVINTSTTIITFLVVFLIQNTQNHDAKAIHIKLDELIRSVEAARTGMIDVESLSDEELDRLDQEFHRLRMREVRDPTKGPGPAEPGSARGTKGRSEADSSHAGRSGVVAPSNARRDRRKSAIHRRRPGH